MIFLGRLLFSYLIVATIIFILAKAQNQSKKDCAKSLVESCERAEFVNKSIHKIMMNNNALIICQSNKSGTSCTKRHSEWVSCSQNHSLYYKGKLLSLNSAKNIDDGICFASDILSDESPKRLYYLDMKKQIEINKEEERKEREEERKESEEERKEREEERKERMNEGKEREREEEREKREKEREEEGEKLTDDKDENKNYTEPQKGIDVDFIDYIKLGDEDDDDKKENKSYREENDKHSKKECVKKLLETCKKPGYATKKMKKFYAILHTPSGKDVDVKCFGGRKGRKCYSNKSLWFACSPNHCATYKGKKLTKKSYKDIDDEICYTARKLAIGSPEYILDKGKGK